MMEGVKKLSALLLVHAVITFAAGVVLVVSPGLIPRTAGVHLEPSAYLMAYLLAGAEFALAFLSYGASRVTDAAALRWIIWSFVVFHASTALLEAFFLLRGFSPVVLANVAARVLISALFVFARPREAS